MSAEYVPDNYDLFEKWDKEQFENIEQLPVCGYCDEPVQAGHYYEINDEVICPDCLDSYFRKEVEI